MVEKRHGAIRDRRKHSKKMLLPLGIVLFLIVGITFIGISGQEASPKTDRVKKKTVSTKQTALQQGDTLTIEKLISLCDQGVLTEVGYDNFVSCKNVQKKTNDDEHVFNEYITCNMNYNKQKYKLDISYEKASRDIETIYLTNETTDEIRILYTSDNRLKEYEVDIHEFLDHSELLDQSVSYILPQGLSNGECFYGYTSDTAYISRLFVKAKSDSIYGYRHTIVWSADGGMMRDCLNVDEETGKLKFHNWQVFRGSGVYTPFGAEISRISGEILETDQGQMAVEKLQITMDDSTGDLSWYYPPDDGRKIDLPQKEKEKLLSKTLWIGYFLPEGEEKSGEGYVFFLDANTYSEKEIKGLLHSVRVVSSDDGDTRNVNERGTIRDSVETDSYTVELTEADPQTLYVTEKETGKQWTLAVMPENADAVMSMKEFGKDRLAVYSHVGPNTGVINTYDLKTKQLLCENYCGTFLECRNHFLFVDLLEEGKQGQLQNEEGKILWEINGDSKGNILDLEQASEKGDLLAVTCEKDKKGKERYLLYKLAVTPKGYTEGNKVELKDGFDERAGFQYNIMKETIEYTNLNNKTQTIKLP